jgi:hypothetical protein
LKFRFVLKQVLKPLLFLVTLVPLYSQQIYFEPEYGYYTPSNWTRIDSITFDTWFIRQDYDFTQSPRWGGNLGLRFDSGYEVYTGYRQWTSSAPKTTVKTISFGIRNTAYLKGRHLGYRAGLEYFRIRNTSNLNVTVATSDTTSTTITGDFKGKGSGSALEAGLVYRLGHRLQLFAGFDYLMYNMVFNRLVQNNTTYTRKELGLNKTKATVDMTGLNLKISISLILSEPLVFDE